MMWLFVLAIVMPITMGSCADLTEVKWAHAVNSVAELSKNLVDQAIDAIEADVILGELKVAVPPAVAEAFKGADKDTKDKDDKKDPTKPEPKKIPVMAHPPATTSDLSLEMFMTAVKAYHTPGSKPAENKTAESKTEDKKPAEDKPAALKQKSIKLDFKSIEALTESVTILEKDWKSYKFPVWINADILEGPKGEKNPTPVDATKFFEAAKKLNGAVLSVGWTTPSTIKSNDTYTEEQTKAMTKVIADSKLDAKTAITFPVRAALAITSKDVLKKLFDETKKTYAATTITIWTGKDDVVDGKELLALVNTFKNENVYLDVPEELRKKMTSGASSLVQYGVLNMIAFAIAVFFRNGLH